LQQQNLFRQSYRQELSRIGLPIAVISELE
jgi:hypothetical protein